MSANNTIDFWFMVGSTYTFDGLAAARSRSGYPNPLPMASIQRARHYARNEQHSVCDQTNQARIHVEGRRAAGIEIWPLQQGAGAVPAEKPGTREPRGCPGRVRRMVCRLCASHISTVAC